MEIWKRVRAGHGGGVLAQLFGLLGWGWGGGGEVDCSAQGLGLDRENPRGQGRTPTRPRHVSLSVCWGGGGSGSHPFLPLQRKGRKHHATPHTNTHPIELSRVRPEERGERTLGAAQPRTKAATHTPHVPRPSHPLLPPPSSFLLSCTTPSSAVDPCAPTDPTHHHPPTNSKPPWMLF